MNTVEMLKIASKAMHISPHSAMQTAERLYLQEVSILSADREYCIPFFI